MSICLIRVVFFYSGFFLPYGRVNIVDEVIKYIAYIYIRGLRKPEIGGKKVNIAPGYHFAPFGK